MCQKMEPIESKKITVKKKKESKKIKLINFPLWSQCQFNSILGKIKL
jgi:hypothetical protein